MMKNKMKVHKDNKITTVRTGSPTGAVKSERHESCFNHSK